MFERNCCLITSLGSASQMQAWAADSIYIIIRLNHVIRVRLTVYHVIRGKSRDACQANCVVKTVGGTDGADGAEERQGKR